MGESTQVRASVRDVVDDLLVERYRRPDRQPDTPDAIKARQRVLAEMPGDELPEDDTR